MCSPCDHQKICSMSSPSRFLPTSISFPPYKLFPSFTKGVTPFFPRSSLQHRRFLARLPLFPPLSSARMWEYSCLPAPPFPPWFPSATIGKAPSTVLPPFFNPWWRSPKTLPWLEWFSFISPFPLQTLLTVLIGKRSLSADRTHSLFLFWEGRSPVPLRV